MKKSIRFLRMWRNRETGSVNSNLDYGVMDTLVRRGIAEFVEEPVVVTETEYPPIRERKSRHRSLVKES